VPRRLASPQTSIVAESNLADLEAARLFEITTPRRYGGLQLDVRTYLDAMVELERGDASVSWVATLVNINNWSVATLFPPEVSEEVFAKPGARTAAVLQPRSRKMRKVSGGCHIEEGYGRSIQASTMPSGIFSGSRYTMRPASFSIWHSRSFQ
jgi:3-hydroxy-9,10-secoandrosta-1,3,5(10)-triene-9,17-dione monooxygenase